MVKKILEYEYPRSIIGELPNQDFFWIVKKVGHDSCLPLLKYASPDQWEYLLDLEIWDKDQIDESQVVLWLKQLKDADSDALGNWLCNEGAYLVHHFLKRNIDVIQVDPDESFDLPGKFFTLDGVLYVRAIKIDYADIAEDIVRILYRENRILATHILENIAGIISAEIEEEMYRLRNIRLAEHGFIPFEEALMVYNPVHPDSLTHAGPVKNLNTVDEEEKKIFTPFLPLSHAGTGTLLTSALTGVSDQTLLDRIRLEFAGLCNQIISADGLARLEHDTLVEKCYTAGGYLNIILEKLCGTDTNRALELIRNNPLESLFRIGFGLAMKLKWRADSWIQTCWFRTKGLETDFWGDLRGMTLAGLLRKKPRYYTGLPEHEYSDFQKLSDLDHAEQILNHIQTIDKILHRLDELHPMDGDQLFEEGVTFQPLIVTFWARQILQLEPGFSKITMEQAQRFFALLRKSEKNPPYAMTGFEETFIRAVSEPVWGTEVAEMGKEALSTLWREFQDEYKEVSVTGLDERFTKYLLIEHFRG